jgi:uncharacterized membrane protein YphA (DoxX/SURF4 family)
MVLSAGLLELAAAASIGLGLLTPLGAIALMGAMIVAAATLWHNGFWAHMGGMEVPFSYALLALFWPGLVRAPIRLMRFSESTSLPGGSPSEASP